LSILIIYIYIYTHFFFDCLICERVQKKTYVYVASNFHKATSLTMCDKLLKPHKNLNFKWITLTQNIKIHPDIMCVMNIVYVFVGDYDSFNVPHVRKNLIKKLIFISLNSF